MAKILPVIHHKSVALTLEQAELALSLGSDGVFLISHRGDDAVLPKLGRWIKEKFPYKFVGLNMLHTDPTSAFNLTYGSDLDALWLDDCGIHSEKISDPAEKLKKLLQNTKRNFDVYGSIAFKYQAHEPDPAKAAQIACEYGFVATTSGPGTGQAPDLEKIISMRQAIDGKLTAIEGELSIASGMDPENVALFAPYVNNFLVSTGISFDFYHINPRKLKDFIAAVKK